MKATKWTAKGLATLLIVVGVAVIVVGAGGILSNMLKITTHVSAGELSQVDVEGEVDYAGEDHLNLPINDGPVVMGVVYDTGIYRRTAVDLGEVVVHFEIAKTGIAVGDVEVQYWAGTGTPPAGSWVTLVMTQGTNVLTGTIGSTGGVVMNAGYAGTTSVLVEFSATGDYVTTIWLTGI